MQSSCQLKEFIKFFSKEMHCEIGAIGIVCENPPDKNPPRKKDKNSSRKKWPLVIGYECVSILNKITSAITNYLSIKNEINYIQLYSLCNTFAKTKRSVVHHLINSSRTLKSEIDKDLRGSSVKGILRMALDIYILLLYLEKIQNEKLYNNGLLNIEFTDNYQWYILIPKNRKIDKSSLEGLKMFYLSNIIFGITSEGSSVRIEVVDECKARVYVEPPPVALKYFKELGIEPHDVPRLVSTALVVASAVINQDSEGAFLQGCSTPCKVFVETPYEPDLELLKKAAEKFYIEMTKHLK